LSGSLLTGGHGGAPDMKEQALGLRLGLRAGRRCGRGLDRCG
jgi:hypothetical protein